MVALDISFSQNLFAQLSACLSFRHKAVASSSSSAQVEQSGALLDNRKDILTDRARERSVHLYTPEE